MSRDFNQALADLPDPLPIPTVERPFDVTIRPPGSKSITNRALLLAALADGTSTLRGALTEADDARVMLRALEQLGAKIEQVADGAAEVLRITGVNGRWRIAPGATVALNLNNAGTATRFLTAAAVLAPPGTSVVIDGDARMRERPIGELTRAMEDLAPGMVEHVARAGYPPVRIRGLAEGAATARTVRFGRTQSSQFISAVLMIAPLLPGGLTVGFDDAITSETYLDMTVRLLGRIGVRVGDDRPGASRSIRIEAQALRAFDLEIEPDASGATYFEAAAAMIPGARATISGLDLHPSRASLQGDTRFVRVLTAMGASVERLSNALRITGPARLAPIDADLSDMPDTAMTAAVLCCFAEPPPPPGNPTATSTLRGLRTLRVKETDRLAALQTELGKLGARVEIVADGGDEALRITPPPSRDGQVNPRIRFATYHDHRMAMALALVGLRVAGIWIENPGCVGKTYPTFWTDLSRITG